MSHLVDILRSVKRSESPSRSTSSTSSQATPTEVMRSPYPTERSKPWVPGNATSRRKSKDVSGPKRYPYPTKPSVGSTSSLSRLDEHSLASSQRIFSPPEPPFQIPDVILILSNSTTAETPMIDSASYTDSSTDSTGPATPINANTRRPLSYSSKPLPPPPFAETTTHLQVPSTAHTGASRRHYSSSPRPSTAPALDLTRQYTTPQPSGRPHHTSSYNISTGFSSDAAASSHDLSWEPPVRTLAVPENATQLSRTQPGHVPLAEREHPNYDVPPPAYQTLETLDNDLDFPTPPATDTKHLSTQQGVPIHHNYFASRQIARSISSRLRAEPLPSSFLDMN